ncbi:hypothetical protein MLD38_022037 [Melastoma candidum]|uniref:Uncharacterized protein n=1 Tax=Melastoma candidum TaxID=119954 RepID=A0ACB9QHB8_9MYRT|nr:hypothetical protein MLD38_022037 [Melastoma candidum]
MKFWLELVPCCGSSTASRRNSPTPGSPPQDNVDSDFTSLVPPPPRRLTKRVRTATVAPRSRSSSSEWCPSLSVIAEDRSTPMSTKGVATVQRKGATSAADMVGSARSGGGRASVGARSRVPDQERRRRDWDDYDYGRSSLPTTMIPAFSPTPFLF